MSSKKINISMASKAVGALVNAKPRMPGSPNLDYEKILKSLEAEALAAQIKFEVSASKSKLNLALVFLITLCFTLPLIIKGFNMFEIAPAVRLAIMILGYMLLGLQLYSTKDKKSKINSFLANRSLNKNYDSSLKDNEASIISNVVFKDDSYSVLSWLTSRYGKQVAETIIALAPTHAGNVSDLIDTALALEEENAKPKRFKSFGLKHK